MRRGSQTLMSKEKHAILHNCTNHCSHRALHHTQPHLPQSTPLTYPDWFEHALVQGKHQEGVALHRPESQTCVAQITNTSHLHGYLSCHSHNCMDTSHATITTAWKPLMSQSQRQVTCMNGSQWNRIRWPPDCWITCCFRWCSQSGGLVTMNVTSHLLGTNEHHKSPAWRGQWLSSPIGGIEVWTETRRRHPAPWRLWRNAPARKRGCDGEQCGVNDTARKGRLRVKLWWNGSEKEMRNRKLDCVIDNDRHIVSKLVQNSMQSLQIHW